MSDKDRPRPDGDGDGGGTGSADGEGTKESSKEKKRNACGGKRPSCFGLRRGKNLLNQKRKQKGFFVNSGTRVGGGGGWCCLCFKQPRTVDSSGESPTSDPNSSEFSFDMLRGLIEKNDFYSKECNPHLDADNC